MKQSRFPEFPYFIFLLALFLRLLFASSLQDRAYWIDENLYLSQASKIVSSGGREVSTLVPPGQSFFLAGVSLLGGNTIANARLIQAFLGALTVLLVYFTGRFLLGETASRISGVAASFYPFLVYIPSILYPQCVFGFLLALAVLLLVKSSEKVKNFYLIPSGIAFGLSALFVPVVAVTLPAFALWILIEKSVAMRERILRILVLALFTALPVALWGFRNYKVEGRFIPIARMGAGAFYAGNNPLADPDEKNFEEWRKKIFSPELMAEIARRGGGPEVAERVYIERATKFIRETPGRFLSLCWKRFVRFFGLYPRTFSKNVHTTTLYLLISVLSFVPVLIFSIVGTAILGEYWRRAFILPVMPLLFALFYSVLGTSVRYRIPVEPYMILLACYGLMGIRALLGKPQPEEKPG